jgi:hypothetical protein
MKIQIPLGYPRGMKYIRIPLNSSFKQNIHMDEPLKITDRATGKELEINPEGSLGLLALGDVALKPWREVRIKSGYEKELLERVEKMKEETEKKKEERKRKQEEKKNNEQKNS